MGEKTEGIKMNKNVESIVKNCSGYKALCNKYLNNSEMNNAKLQLENFINDFNVNNSVREIKTSLLNLKDCFIISRSSHITYFSKYVNISFVHIYF